MSRSLLSRVLWLALASLPLVWGLAPAGSVRLAWDASPSEGVLGYRLYYGLASGQYDTRVDAGPALMAQLDGLTAGLTYVFAATAYSASAESAFSHEVSALISADDTTPPSVGMTFPSDGSRVPRRSLVTVLIEASDNVAVSQVELAINGAVHCVDAEAPYTCDWQVPARRGQTYQLQATAEDTAGLTRASSVVQVTAR